jgi:hypothetical protein
VLSLPKERRRPCRQARSVPEGGSCAMGAESRAAVAPVEAGRGGAVPCPVAVTPCRGAGPGLFFFHDKEELKNRGCEACTFRPDVPPATVCETRFARTAQIS